MEKIGELDFKDPSEAPAQDIIEQEVNTGVEHDQQISDRDKVKR